MKKIAIIHDWLTGVQGRGEGHSINIGFHFTQPNLLKLLLLYWKKHIPVSCLLFSLSSSHSNVSFMLPYLKAVYPILPYTV